MKPKLECPRIAVVGCGAAAREFCLPVLKRFPHYRDRVVLVDQSAAQAEKTAAEWQIRHWCTDYTQLSREVDAALVTTPHHLHARHALHFLRRGRPVLVEKPLGVTSAEASEMVEAASAAGVTLMVNNYRRLFPSYRHVRELLGSGELGPVRNVTIDDGTKFAWQSASGFYLRDSAARGVLLDRGAHTVDVVCWWLQGTPTVVEAHSDSVGGIEALVKLHLDWNGIPIRLMFSRLQRLKNEYSIECERGLIRGRLFDLATVTVESEGVKRSIRCGAARTYADWGWELVSNFVQVVAGAAEPCFVARDVLPSIGVIERAYAAARPFELPWYDDDPNGKWLAGWKEWAGTAVASASGQLETGGGAQGDRS